MKRKIFLVALMAASLAVTTNAYAVSPDNDDPASVVMLKGYEVKPLDPKLEEMCNQIINMQTVDPEESNRIFTKLIRKIRNNKEGLISVGDFFLNQKLYQVANICATTLYKLDPTYIPGLMFSGQVAKARGFASNNDSFFGVAGQKYDEVLAIDPNNIPALRQNVLVYKKINPAAAHFLKRIAEIDPNDYTVERDLGDIRYDADAYGDAVKYYEKYFAACPADKINEISAVNYANSLFSVGEYKKMKAFVLPMQEKFPKNIAFYRMNFVADMSLDDTEAAKKSVAYITEKMFPADRYIFMDYQYQASLETALGNDNKAIECYKEAMNVADTTTTIGRNQLVGAYQQLSSLYRRENKIQEAIDAYDEYLKLKGGPVSLEDHYLLGMICVAGLNQDSITAEQKEKFRKEGDAHFAAIENEKPDYYKASYRRAILNITDPTKPEDKPAELYEKVLKYAPKDNDDVAAKSFRSGSCRYLIFYYVQKDDIPNLKRVTDILLSIDPENNIAKNALKYIEMSQSK